MAAEKLTKHRLAQILITLCLLLIAFFWRTLTYTDTDSIKCVVKPNCSVFVNGQKITVTKDNKNDQVLIIYPSKPEWNFEYDGEVISTENSTTLVPRNNNLNTPQTLVINETVKIHFEL